MLSLNYENHLFTQGYTSVAGIDEVGRGPLAGPVVAAVVLVDQNFQEKFPELPLLTQIRDSKKISSNKRKKLYYQIKDNCPSVGIGLCDNETIDRLNILQASFLAMKKALSDLQIAPDLILVDGKFRIPKCSYNQKSFPGGDGKIFSVAAASIVAKVTRDTIMEEYHKEYPQYGFDRHKGYGTKQHIETLKQHGPCDIHRKSFAPISQN